MEIAPSRGQPTFGADVRTPQDLFCLPALYCFAWSYGFYGFLPFGGVSFTVTCFFFFLLPSVSRSAHMCVCLWLIIYGSVDRVDRVERTRRIGWHLRRSLWLPSCWLPIESLDLGPSQPTKLIAGIVQHSERLSLKRPRSPTSLITLLYLH